MARQTRSGNYHVQVRFGCVGVWLGSSAGGCVASPIVRGQNPPSRHAPQAPPFAKAGTPRQTERIRFFDVKHIKAELTSTPQKHKISGVVTHTLSPLHPYLTQVELDCGPELKVTKVTAGRPVDTLQVRDEATASLSITLDKAYGPDDTIDLAIEYSGSPDARALFRRRRQRRIPRSRCRSGPRARPRTRATGSPATTIPTSAPPAR